MDELLESISYLKGFSEGLNIAEKSDEGRILVKIIDALSSAYRAINDLKAENESLSLRFDTQDDRLSDIEGELDMISDAMEEYSDDLDDDLFDEDDDDDLFEMSCPECGEDIIVDYGMLDDENRIVCPHCHTEIDLNFDFDGDDDESVPDSDYRDLHYLDLNAEDDGEDDEDDDSISD